MNRLVSLDYFRVLSIFGIILCHCCFGIEGFSFLGSFLGGTFNVVFLTLSAFLLGLSWEKKDFKPYKFDFFWHRITKLLYSYYPFLIMMFAFMAIVNQDFSIKDVLMHTCLLPWFDKLPGFGHLWFITMIVICYCGIFVASRISIIRTKYFAILLLIGGGVSQMILGYIGQPNYLFLYLFLYVAVFANARKVMVFANNVRLLPVGALTLCSFLVVIALFYINALNKFTSVWCGMLCAILFFLFTNKALLNAQPNRVINFISNISFEIYLVHHVFCFGKYSLFQVVDNPLLGILIIILLSIMLAYPLHWVGNKIQSVLPIAKIGKVN